MEHRIDCGSRPPLGVHRRFPEGPLIRDIAQVSAAPIGEEPAVPVRTARVVCANYRAIVHDFPQVFSPEARRSRPLDGCAACAAADRACPQAINDWLIRNAAFVSLQQAQPNAVNTPVAFGEGIRTAYRPHDYGRALIVPVDTPADAGGANYLDLKGAGVAPGKTPSQALYANGLEYLGYAIADFFYGWLVDSIFARTFPGYHTVPVYAVIDLGFDIVGGWHGTGPAGLHVRRAHARPAEAAWLPPSGSDRERLMLHIELLLRTFGLTTAGPGAAFDLAEGKDGEPVLRYNGTVMPIESDAEREKAARVIQVIQGSGGARLEMVNVQLANATDWAAKSAQMYDFGQVNARRAFVHPLANPVLNGALQVGRILSPTDRLFVRPNAAVAVDAQLCDRHSVNAYGFFAAQGFRSMGDRFGQHEIETMLRIGRLRALRRGLARIERTASPAPAPALAQRAAA